MCFNLEQLLGWFGPFLNNLAAMVFKKTLTRWFSFEIENT